ncbi:keratinocyte proline-rich protein-like [Homarus americanus]|uniref:keratinocyte proline-rich protein-like n=1 Tax=Homarus americanus TaxID=6706 RepID=UPI001C48EFA2|nr:keratinocyte proline-rich protein-like [Homarus americanus]XP_042216259.1 keratinocyte proline-rich protein-like [Homarus americanus]XP_042216260.1 keratinocyte proline-rich protein-like [Homarus americanus]
MREVTIVVTILTIVTCPLLVTSMAAGPTVYSWGQEFCKLSLCSIMPSDRWQACCDDYSRCCAYLEYAKPQGPFSFREREHTSHALVSRPDHLPRAENGHSIRSQPLKDEPSIPREPTPRPTPRPTPEPTPETISNHRPQVIRQPPSFSQTRPLPAPVEALPSPVHRPSKSYNEVIRRKEEQYCRAKFCSLLEGNKQQRCCDHYKQCCVYANMRRNDGSFHYDKDPWNY